MSSLLVLSVIPPVMSAACDAQVGMQCHGMDITDAGVMGSSADCCVACQAQSDCKAWSEASDLNP